MTLNCHSAINLTSYCWRCEDVVNLTSWFERCSNVVNATSVVYYELNLLSKVEIKFCVGGTTLWPYNNPVTMLCVGWVPSLLSNIKYKQNISRRVLLPPIWLASYFYRKKNVLENQSTTVNQKRKSSGQDMYVCDMTTPFPVPTRTQIHTNFQKAYVNTSVTEAVARR